MELFTGEALSLEKKDTLDIYMTDDEINQKYMDGEIRIVTEQARYPLNTISAMVNNDKYKLDPEYQRRHRWSPEKRSALIESLIMNVPLPPVFLYEYEYSSYEVMDGLQRLTAIASFYEDEYKLVGLKKWPELNGKKYSELPSVVKQGIDRRYISSIILLHETAKTPSEAEGLKQMVFDRLNSGGVILTYQEKRNANFDGRLNRLCLELSSSEFLCKTWGIPCPTHDDDPIHSDRAKNDLFKKMVDVELVLRFFANRQNDDIKSKFKNKSLTLYLDKYLEFGNQFSQEVIESLRETFEKTIKLAYDIFGEQAFYLYRIRNGVRILYERPTTAVYDPLMYVLNSHIDSADVLISKKDKIVQGIGEFYYSNYAVFEGRNTNPAALKVREQKFDEFITQFL